jgi:hypothetical protein
MIPPTIVILSEVVVREANGNAVEGPLWLCRALEMQGILAEQGRRENSSQYLWWRKTGRGPSTP